MLAGTDLRNLSFDISESLRLLMAELGRMSS